jgi:carboxyl-terminal processing protease
LQDQDRAVLVGGTTYGKGSAQSVFPLSNGGALKLTTALWYTPSGRSISRPHSAREDPDDVADRAAPDSARARVKFRTRGGRVVYGGGGVTPDVIVPADSPATGQRELDGALGKRIPEFRQAIAAYARTLRGRAGVTTPDFAVTPDMLDDLYRSLERSGVTLDRAMYDRASPAVSEMLGDEAARVLFGRGAEFRRRLADDRSVAAAVGLLAGARSPDEVLRRAAARQRTAGAASQ